MSNYNGMEVAVIGMAGRFPGADNLNDFWKNIQDGVESISFFSEEELLAEGESKSQIDHPKYVRANGFLQDKEYYDAAFFDKLPDEVSLMDPQIRVFQQCLWHAMEDTGYNVYDYDGKIGLFAGGASNVNWLNYAQIANQRKMLDNFTVDILSDIQYLCTSTSYLFNLRGPSVYVNTACSTSLVAIQRATMSLLLQECNMAIAGGVSINSYSKKGYRYQEGLIFSKDGHCRTFDVNASGTVGGEGVGVVVLKRLKDALRDNDSIHAVIKGGSVNNDGCQKVGFTAPSIDGQYEAIVKARKIAKVEKESIGYIEAHGTATVLGDPIEVEALNLAFGKSDTPYCALGSVKTNIGHANSAAGVAGFIKTVLALKHRQIPASLHFQKPNPKIDFNQSPFYVNTHLKEWKSDTYPRRAGVSSFGIGGTNAHLIMEEAPAREPSSGSRPYQLLTISAKTPTALQYNTTNLKNYLAHHQDSKLADVAYTLNTGRASFPYRQTLVCGHHQEAIEQLASAADQCQSTDACSEKRPATVFMFPGQGAQYVGMGADLFQQERVFREEAEACFQIVQHQSGKDIKSVLFSDKQGTIHETEFTQPALFIVEYALARLLMSWGIQPDTLIGHSIGEYVAACLSGVFSLKDALFLVIKRGELMQRAPRGAMLSILVTEPELQPYLKRHQEVSLAAVNSSSSCVVSGPKVAIETFKKDMEEDGLLCKEIRTSHAFHSHMMESVLIDFKECVNRVKLVPPTLPFISNVTGREAGSEVLTPSYWVNQLRHTVKFAEGVAHLMDEPNVLFVEVGPGKALSSFVGGNDRKSADHKVVNLLGSSHPGNDTLPALLKGVGKLWTNGLEPNWTNFYSGETRCKVSLPGYAFDKTAYPVNVDARQMIEEMFSGGAVVKKKQADWLYAPAWEVAKPSAKQTEGKCFNVLFVNHSGLAEACQQKFAERGEDFVLVNKGGAFKQEDQQYQLNPWSEEDYIRLFETLVLVAEPIRLIFAWGVSVNDEPLTVKKAKTELNEGYYSLLNIARGLDKAYIRQRVQLVSITTHVHEVLHGEVVSPEKTPLLAAVKVIPKEYEHIRCRNIDIPPLDINSGTTTATQAVEEAFSAYEHPLVALRYGTRFVPTLTSVKRTQENIDCQFTSGGTYLITGGTGGMGLTFARRISETTAGVNLILLGRKELPAQDQWSNWLREHGPEDPHYTIISTFLALKENGSRVVYTKADLTDVASLRSTVDTVEAEFGSVNGVIHAAGIGDYAGLIQRRNREDNEAVFSPKVYGTLALQEVFVDRQPDFIVLCSSLASQIAPAGQVGYVAANLFMESFAAKCTAHGLKVISIGWNQWREVGMAAAAVVKGEQQYLDNSISPEEGYELLVACMKSNLPELYISNVDPALYAEAEGRQEAESEAEVVLEFNSDTLESKILSIWHHFFGRTDIGIHDDFFEVGGDSLKALTLVSRMNKVLQVNIALSHFIENPSVSAISDYLAQVCNASLAVKPVPTISPAEEREYYKLSSAQRRLYFLYELDKTSLAYNVAQTIQLEGELDVERLSGAFKQLVHRHESLRTAFQYAGGCVVQKVVPHVDVEVEVVEAKEENVEELQRDFIRTFDLSQAPLLRMRLVKLAPKKHRLMVDIHHIIADGASQAILIKDFMALYNEEALPKLPLQYKDYCEWQQENKEERSVEQAFWKEAFSEGTTALNLPTDFPRPAEKSFTGDHLSFVLDEAVTGKLRNVAQASGATMFMTLLALFNVLLSKLSNQKEVTVGVPVMGRDHADLESIMGMFVNTLAIRNYLDSMSTFRSFLEEVKQRALACLNHHMYPYEELIDDLNVWRDTGRNPLFDVMFTFQNFTSEDLVIPGLKITSVGNVQQISKFDLTLTAEEYQDELRLEFEYSTKLFERSTIERFIAYFQKIVGEVVADADRKLSEIDMLSSTERQQLLVDFNATDVEYPQGQTVLDLWEAQVSKTPDRIAFRWGESCVSYRALWQSSDQMASYLQQEMGVRRGDRVGLLLEREACLLASVFGILKAGAAYVPLSTDHPPARSQAVIEDAGLKALISRGRHATAAGIEMKTGLVDLDEAWKCINQRAIEQPIVGPTSSDLAYVIYTSGSTGKPKGVMIEHHSVVNRLLWMQEEYPITPEDVLLQKTPLVFDVSVWELFWWSLTGASVCLLPPEEEKDPKQVIEAIERHRISVVHFVPSMLTPFLQAVAYRENAQLNHLRRVFCSGEALGAEQVATFGKTLNQAYSTQLINLYGPTEATVDVSHYPCDFTQVPASIPIGKPIANIKLHILNTNDGLCPIGVPGELCIEGAGLGRGYLGADPLTEEKFVSHPHQPGGRLYRTGDLACWLPNGNIKFLGRIDHQVKIRGFRIELGEIESQLSSYEGIQDAVVLVKEKEGDKYLVGYYVSEVEVPSTECRDFLTQRLPAYMVPSHFIRLDTFPLTTSGKVDRKALPDPVMMAGQDYVGPSNETEEALVRIWSEVLSIDPVDASTTASFFSLGGHSLKATVLVNKIAQQFQVQLPLKEVFRHQDIRSLSKFILSQNESAYAEISPAVEQEYYPLSSAQRRMYFLYEYDRTSLAYNMPQVVRLEGEVDQNHLERVFAQLVARHEVLRTSFEVVDGERVQKIHEQVAFELESHQATESEAQRVIEHFIRPFDLSQASQLRVGLIQLSDASHLLIVDMHHIVTDGVSQNLLIKDFMALYNEKSLPELPLQYKDYCEWQQEEQQQERMKVQREFWLAEFAQEVSGLDLPTDSARPMTKSYRGSQVTCTLNKQQSDDLRRLTDAVGGTMFMTILSAFNVLLSKLSGQSDITVGVPVAGREHSGLEEVMGLFVNTLALRNRVDMEQDFKALLTAVKQKALACFDHQAFPYEALVEELNIPRDTGRNPLFDVMFSYQNFEQEALVVPGLTLHAYPYRHSTAKVDLELVVVESNDELHLTFEYATDLFDEGRIKRWAGYFAKLVQQLTGNADQPLSEVDVLSEAEREQILHAFNDTAADYPLHKTMVELFEEQVASSSKTIAACDQNVQISYTDLNERANQLAHCLLSEGMTPEMPVVMLSERSVDMLAGVLGIFKAGGAYVPLSPAYPQSRIAQVVKDAQPGFVMTTSRLLSEEIQETLTSLVPGVRVLCLDTMNDIKIPDQSSYGSVPQGLSIIDRSVWQQQSADNPSVKVVPDQLAYILYTSGSTGVPKGVMIEHRGMLNHLLAKRDTLQLSADSVVAQNASETFDISIWQFFSALLVGGKTVIYSKAQVLEPNKLLYQLHQDGVTILEVVPSYLSVLLTHLEEGHEGLLSGLSYLLVTGEVLSKKLVERWLAYSPHTPMVNAYGPTEASDDITQCVLKEVPSGALVPIGKVLPNLQVYVVDAYMNLCPVGVKGEIVVSGVGVGRGYLNRPDKTAAVFVTDPFASEPAERMYRTGDVGRWLTDGSLEFLGRKDHQVKISGHRIELGEVEACLSRQEGVTEAVVLDRQHEGTPYLIGYYVTEEVSVDTLRNHLLSYLPEYMVPAYLVPMEALPLTPNGKVDRKALPDPEITAGQDYVAPSNETEKALVEIWSEVLKINQEVISVSANFFELGGHSLVATTLVNRVSKHFETEFTLADVFTKQNVRAQAEYIELNGWLLTTEVSDEEMTGITI